MIDPREDESGRLSPRDSIYDRSRYLSEGRGPLLRRIVDKDGTVSYRLPFRCDREDW